MTDFLLLSLAGLLVIAVGSWGWAKWSERSHRKQLAKWPHDDELAMIEAAFGKLHWPEDRKHERIVLVIGGFLHAPFDMLPVTRRLDETDVAFDAPWITGFGSSDLRLQRATHQRDWMREVWHAYLRCQSLAKRVDVVAMSNGCLLTTWLASRAKLGRVIFLVPNLACARDDRLLKRLALNLASFGLVRRISPYIRLPRRRMTRSDGLDIVATERPPDLPSVTVGTLSAVLSMWRLQDWVDAQALNNVDSLHVIWAGDDRMVDNHDGRQRLTDANLEFSEETFEESGHSIFFDAHGDRIVERVVELLIHPPAGPVACEPGAEGSGDGHRA